jgi:transcriptional regulator with XRE-family HTH domain
MTLYVLFTEQKVRHIVAPQIMRRQNMQLDPQRLKRCLEIEGLKNVELAKKLGCTGRTIGRWLKGDVNPPSVTIHKMAKVLKVDVEVLSGRAPMPERKSNNSEAHRSRITADISSRTKNAYYFAYKRYGVTPAKICELSPLLFALIAEGSLDLRRDKLEKAEQHVDELSHLSRGYSSYLYPSNFDNGAYAERASIEKQDIFGEHVDVHNYDRGYRQEIENPFFDYLMHLSDKLTDKAAVRLENEEDINFTNVPAFSLFHEELKEFTGGDEKLADKVAVGTIDLGKVPKKLLSVDAQEKRIEWMNQEAKRIMEEARKMLADIENYNWEANLI